MWTRQENRRHVFLHRSCLNIAPEILNKSLNEILGYSMTPKFSESTESDHKYIKQKLAFGYRGIQKLICQINDNDEYIRNNALFWLTQEIIDPENCFRAVKKYFLSKRLFTIFQKSIYYNWEPTLILCLELFDIMAIHDLVARGIIGENLLLQKVHDLIKNNDVVSKKAAKVLGTISTHIDIAGLMVKMNFLLAMKNIIIKNFNSFDVYLTLANLIERSKLKALNLGYFEILLSQIQIQDSLLNIKLKCFALLISCSLGRKKCDEMDVVNILYKLLKDEYLNNEVKEYAALALQNCTLTTYSRWRCKEFYDLPQILILKANTKSNIRMQNYCFQILRQITEMPSIKNYVRKNFIKDIENILSDDESVNKFKQNLLEWLNYRIYECLENDAKMF